VAHSAVVRGSFGELVLLQLGNGSSLNDSVGVIFEKRELLSQVWWDGCKGSAQCLTGMHVP
jgi:hypothetical protein